MSPYFQAGYDQRQTYYTRAVVDGFGAPSDQFRAVARVPGLSWRTAALGLTLPVYQDAVPRLARGVLSPVIEQSRDIADLIRDPMRERPDRLSRLLTWIESLSNAAFIQLLEVLNYPVIVLRAALTMWQNMEARLRRFGDMWAHYLQDEFWEAGQRFLGTARTMRDRMRVGGLLPENREMLNILALGVVGEAWKRSQLIRDLWTLFDWIGGLFRRDDKQPPTDDTSATAPAALTFVPRFHLFGLELETRAGDAVFAHSAHGIKSGQVTWFEPAESVADTDRIVQAHADRWALEHHRRQALYRLGSNVVGLVLKYIAMGPIGLVVSVLQLLTEGLFDVARNCRKLIWPAELPDPEQINV